MIRKLAVVGLGMVLMAMTMTACGGDDATPKAEDAWARTSAMMQDAGAVYVTITGGDAADRLVKAQAPTDIAAMTEIHETTMNDEGTMMMGEVPAIDVPAETTVMLEPGGYHIMLMNLAAPLESGQQFDVVLTFETAGDVTVPVEVREQE
jgi:copper(I)-binding protein